MKKKESKLYILVPIMILAMSISMFAVLFHCPPWIQEMGQVRAALFIIAAILFLVIGVVLLIECFSNQ